MVRVSGSDQLAAGECRVNDTVEIALHESALLLAALMAYAMPLALGISGAVLLSFQGELASILGFCIGLAAGFGINRWGSGSPMWGSLTRWEPYLVNRVSAEPTVIVSVPS